MFTTAECLLELNLCLSDFQFDTNGDGQISTAELREAMKKLLGQQVPTSVSQCLPDFCHAFGFSLSLCHGRSHLSLALTFLQVGHRDLEEILRDIDLNGDGHVDFEGTAVCPQHHIPLVHTVPEILAHISFKGTFTFI